MGFSDVLAGIAKASHQHELNLVEMASQERRDNASFFAKMSENPNLRPEQQEWFMRGALAWHTDPKTAKKDFNLKDGRVMVPAEVMAPPEPPQPLALKSTGQATNSGVRALPQEPQGPPMPPQAAPQEGDIPVPPRISALAGPSFEPTPPTGNVSTARVTGGFGASNINPPAPPPQSVSAFRPMPEYHQRQIALAEQAKQKAELDRQISVEEAKAAIEAAQRPGATADAIERARQIAKIQGDQLRETEDQRARNARELKGTPASTAAKPPIKLGQYQGDDGKVHIVMGTVQPDGKVAKFEIDSDGQVKKTSGFERFGSAGTSITAARELADQGIIFNDRDGNPLDLSELPDSMKLMPIAGHPDQYQLASQKLVTKTVNNRVIQYPEFHVGDPYFAKDVGVARVGTETTREAVIGTDSEGRQIIGTLAGSQTPAGAPRPPSANTGTRQTDAISPGQVTAQRNLGLRLSESGNQLFVDPAHPEVPALESFSKLADVPSSRAKVGTAFNTIKRVMDKDANSNAGASLGVVHIGGSDIATWLGNVTGFTQMVGESDAKTVMSAVNALSPEEDKALASLMSAYGTIVGLRSATGGGAYKFATDAMERELPTLFNSQSASAYNYRLAILGRELAAGFERLASPEDRARGRQYRDAAARLSGSSVPTPPTGAKAGAAAPKADPLGIR